MASRRNVTWTRHEAESRLADATPRLNYQFGRSHMGMDSKGLYLSQYKNTWQRKRESSYLIEICYKWDDKIIMRHVEPWVNFPSDVLIAKLMLLPLEVKE